MTVLRVIVIGALIALTVGAAVWWRAREPAAAPPGDRDEPAAPAGEHGSGAVCRVTVTPIQRGVLQRVIGAYGTVSAPAQSIHSVTTPIEVVIRAMRVANGAAVSKGSILATASLTPDSAAARAEALAARETARAAVSQAEERLSLHVATTQEVQQAKQALAMAEPKAALWDARPAETSWDIVAGAAGSVAKVAVQAGQIVPAGGVIADISGVEREARLGCEPLDAARVKPGNPVRIAAPRRRDLPAMTGSIVAVSSVVSVDSRLVDLLVSLPASDLPIGEVVRGEILLPLPESWIVPREAVVLDDEGAAIFQVDDGKARRRSVTIVGSAGDRTAVAGDDISAASALVVEGSYQLEDGMDVETEPAK